MIIQADILDYGKSYDGPLYHAAFMDAPYEIEFMGKGWDGTGVASNPDTWRAIARCLHPGAFLFVYAGTLNDDLISVAMRQAGLRKYHRAAAWIYGSGFPKSARLDTVIDRRAGVERTKVGTRRHQPKFAAKDFDYRKKDNGYNSRERQTFDLTKPATELAETWEGYRYGGQMLKPALEPILIFQKPYEGDPVSSITKTGAGALWIDGARIGEETVGWGGGGVSGAVFNDLSSGLSKGGAPRPVTGRWPANFSLSHHPDCNGACVPDCPVARLGAQSGEKTSGGFPERHGIKNDGVYGRFQGEATGREGDLRSSGTAARFFHNADWLAERLEATDPVGYYAKASKGEREAGLDDMQVRLMRDLYGADDEGFEDDTIDDGRSTPIDNPFQRGETTRKNIHPTVKPIALNRWLATLLLPPLRYAPRRLLIPFAGVASEYIGAMLAGWEEIVGVELEEQHVRIAEARIAYWEQMRHRVDLRVRIKDKVPEGQMTLF